MSLANCSDVMVSTAEISRDQLYRYSLTRRWAKGGSVLTFIMLNPSTADAHQDDPTIRRCIGFARREGCNALLVLNLFAYRATSPENMKAAADPVGPENDAFLIKHLNALYPSAGDKVVAGWGTHGSFARRDLHVMQLATAAAGVPLLHLGLTKEGHPRHPLYVKGDQPFGELTRV